LVHAEVHLPHGVEIYKRTSDASDDKKYQFRTLFVAWLTFAALVIYAFISGWQLYEMRKATVATTSQLELSERPWISLENFTIESPLTFDKNGFHLTVGYEVKNTGHSPAIRGFWQTDFFLQFAETPSPVKKRNDACKVAMTRSTTVTNSQLTETWFPGDALPKGIVVSASTADIANALKLPSRIFPATPHMKEFDYINPDFVVCMAYRAAFTDTQYHTWYILELARTNPKIPYILPMQSGEIPANELRLYVHPFYGIDAD